MVFEQVHWGPQMAIWWGVLCNLSHHMESPPRTDKQTDRQKIITWSTNEPEQVLVADGDGRKREARSVRHFHVYVFGPRSVEEVTGDEQIREGSDGARDNDEPQEPTNINGSGKFTLK